MNIAEIMVTISAAMGAMKQTGDAVETLAAALRKFSGTDRTLLDKMAVVEREQATLHKHHLDLIQQCTALAKAAADAEKRAIEAERRLHEFEEWQGIAKDYKLVGRFDGTMCRTYAPTSPGSHEPHDICPNCFDRRERSFLQQHDFTFRARIMLCKLCGYEVSYPRDTEDTVTLVPVRRRGFDDIL